MRVKLFENDSKEEKKTGEDSFIQYVSKNKYKLILLIAGLLTISIYAVKCGMSKEFVTKKYCKAYSLYNEKPNKNIEQMVKTVDNDNDLGPHFDHSLRTHFILNDDVGNASKYIDKILERLSFIDVDYLSFAKTSKLIEEKNFTAALSDALSLQDNLLSSDKKSSKLYLFNLVRIMMLGKLLKIETNRDALSLELLDIVSEFENQKNKPEATKLLSHFGLNNNTDLMGFLSNKL